MYRENKKRVTVWSFVFAAVTALVLCAVCVGGVSGAVFEVASETELREAVSTANGNGEDDTIIITSSFSRTTNTPIEVSGEKLTIMNKEGEDVTITIGSAGFLRSSNSLFRVNGCELVLNTASSGSLTIKGSGQIVGDPGGGAVYVENGGSLVMNDGVLITNFGLWGGASASFTGVSYDGAGIYVANGTFTMNGGSITECNAAHGGAVYISPEGTCTINGGTITKNGHVYTWGFVVLHQSEGGAVYVESGGHLIQNGGTISGNYGNPADISYTGDPAEDPDPDTPEVPVVIQYTIRHNTQNSDDLSTYSHVGSSNVFGSIGDNPLNLSNSYPGYEAVYCVPESVSATTTTTGVDIYYDFNISYSIIIPDTLLITWDTNYALMNLTVSDMWVPEVGFVAVNVSSKNTFNLVLNSTYNPTDTTIALPYVLTKDEDDSIIPDGGVCAEFTMSEFQQSTSEKPSVTLNATVVGHPPFSGTYEDIMTFTMEYIPA